MALKRLVHQAEPARDLGKADKVWMQSWIAGHADLIAKEGTFPFLNAAKREIAQLGQLRLEDAAPRIASWWFAPGQTIRMPGWPTG